jgi:hypothetical protein
MHVDSGRFEKSGALKFKGEGALGSSHSVVCLLAFNGQYEVYTPCLDRRLHLKHICASGGMEMLAVHSSPLCGTRAAETISLSFFFFLGLLGLVLLTTRLNVVRRKLGGSLTNDFIVRRERTEE